MRHHHQRNEWVLSEQMNTGEKGYVCFRCHGDMATKILV